MDDNLRMILIKGIEVMKDISLVIAGAIATYLAQKALFNKQHHLEIEKKRKKLFLMQ